MHENLDYYNNKKIWMFMVEVYLNETLHVKYSAIYSEYILLNSEYMNDSFIICFLTWKNQLLKLY